MTVLVNLILQITMDSLSNLYIHRENLAWGAEKHQLPVTLVTGFLGAGKTTLLNHVLNNKHNLKIAAAVNDFAEVNIDSQIVRRNKAHDSVVELTNGCLCCSISTEFKTAVWSLLQDVDIGKIDYLMIETSGVTDPHSTIATLEQDYGKMYRIRLDAIITVVDTDALVAKLTEGAFDVLSAAAADSQLKCADVVLLNKKDLVSEAQLETAKSFIQRYVPGAQVYACEKCAVPLHYIMEVNEVAAGPQVVSHEVTSTAYTVSYEGGVMNEERRRRWKEEGKSGGDHSASHILQDEFSSVVFESSKPLSLGAFQLFLGRKFPHGVSRIKGTIWFEENRSYLYSFHMSGRQRYEILPCASLSESLTGAFSVQLAVIGRRIDPVSIKTSLESCVTCTDQESDAYADAKAMIAKDDRFEVIEASMKTYNIDESQNQLASRYIDFRLTGCVEYGITVQEAESIHGINFNKMNLELARRVNGSSGPVSILPVMFPNGLQVCRHALHTSVPLGEAWKLVAEVAKKLVAEFYRAVGYCKCGM